MHLALACGLFPCISAVFCGIGMIPCLFLLSGVCISICCVSMLSMSRSKWCCLFHSVIGIMYQLCNSNTTSKYSREMLRSKCCIAFNPCHPMPYQYTILLLSNSPQKHPPTPPSPHSKSPSHPPPHHCSSRDLQLHPPLPSSPSPAPQASSPPS